MAEAVIGVGSGIVGVVVAALHGTRLLINDINSIIDAPEHVQRLEGELTSTASALESLRGVEESEWESLGTSVTAQAKDAVQTCVSACETFRRDLTNWTKRSRSGQLHWRDRFKVGFFKQKQINTMAAHLQSCRLTCTSVMSAGTMYASLRSSRMTAELQTIIETQQEEVSSAAEQTDSSLALVFQEMQLIGNHPSSTTGEDDDEQDDMIAAETQLSDLRAGLEACKSLFSELHSKLREEEARKDAKGESGNTNISFGTVRDSLVAGVNSGNMTYNRK